MKKDKYRVDRKYRTHPDSKVDGGVTVVVEFKDKSKSSREYPDVKNSDAFIRAIYRNDVDGEVERAYVAQPKQEDQK